jgi:hypothetical protein
MRKVQQCSDEMKIVEKNLEDIWDEMKCGMLRVQCEVCSLEFQVWHLEQCTIATSTLPGPASGTTGIRIYVLYPKILKNNFLLCNVVALRKKINHLGCFWATMTSSPVGVSQRTTGVVSRELLMVSRMPRCEASMVLVYMHSYMTKPLIYMGHIYIYGPVLM